MIKIISPRYKVKKRVFYEKIKKVFKALKITGQVTIMLGDEQQVLSLNKTYRHKNSPTDVLSFPVREDLPEGFYLGDIFICYPIAVNQARENDHSLETELLTLIIHGILHLVGYDHEKDDGEMNQLQERLLKMSLG